MFVNQDISGNTFQHFFLTILHPMVTWYNYASFHYYILLALQPYDI